MSETAKAAFELGEGCDIAETAIVGANANGPTRIGDDATIRAGTIIYGDVEIGDGFTTGHNALVREDTTIGDDTLIGTHVVLEGSVEVGSRVSLQTGAYLPTNTTVSDKVFFGPHAVVTNDPYPVRESSELNGVTIESGATVGSNATILPGVTIGKNAFVAAGAVVTGDVPSDSLAVGAPATHEPLPDYLQGGNDL